jgi:5-methylcytosine-specific restriction enzyme A
MPHRPKQPCGEPGCNVLTDGKRCDLHRRAQVREYDQHRPSAAKRLYGREWQRESKLFLRAHPLCQCPHCDEGRTRVRRADVVDHRKPHRGNPALFWDRKNWQAMAKECHDSKTAREDGGFGRAPGAGRISGASSP